jgi:hypothetical protein
MDLRRPTVTGPTTGDRRPWGAPRIDADDVGYVVEEYLLEGVTCAYAIDGGERPPSDGRWRVVDAGDAPYRTRVLVVRPRDPARFNGIVVLNWQNVSAGFEQPAPDHGEVYDGGYAWVGVSAQEVGVYGFPLGMRSPGALGGVPLVDHDRRRYGRLLHPGDPGSFDIFRQAALAVGRDRDRTVDPLGGLPVRHVLASGGSQSAMRLAAYYNALQPLARVVDGFLLAVWEARAPRPEEGFAGMGVRTALRTDEPTPVLVVNSEFEATPMRYVPAADAEHVRIWEVAGTAHGRARPRGETRDTHGWVVNPLTWSPVYDAGLRALRRWVGEGVPAPTQPWIETDPNAADALRRDRDGNVVGGIRLPELAAPTHEYRGMSFGAGRAPLFGSARRLPDDVLLARYPTRAVYVERWNAAVDDLVASGAMRPEDAAEARARVDDVELPVG